MSRIIPLAEARPREPKPDWLKVRAPGSPNYLRLKELMRDLKLNTVCEDARCPNIGECWHHGTATFMILGDVCTRACAYCAVAHGRPHELDTGRAGARRRRGRRRSACSYVVITSVDRDDLADGGASIFAETIRQTRARVPGCRIEVLIPDFQGNESSLHAVLDARPGRAQSQHRDGAAALSHGAIGRPLPRTLELLDRSRTLRAGHPDQDRPHGRPRRRARRAPRDASTICATRRRVDILTIGQYLRPSPTHAPMARYYHPDEFRELKAIALDLGFVHVESGPLVRSSYHAHEQADAFAAAAAR